jgi:adenylate kinase family enzyme
MPDNKQYSGTSRDQLNCIRKDLQSMGIHLPEGDSGNIEYQGVKLTVTYTEPEQNLIVKILEKPAFVPEAMVWQLLEARIQKCKSGA